MRPSWRPRRASSTRPARQLRARAGMLREFSSGTRSESTSRNIAAKDWARAGPQHRHGCLGSAGVRGLGDYRKRFDLLAGYVFDAWGSYPSFVRKFDRLFIPVPEQVEVWQNVLGSVPRSCLLARDALADGATAVTAPSMCSAMAECRPLIWRRSSSTSPAAESRTMFVRVEGRKPVAHPELPYEQRGDHHYYDSLGDLLRRSRISFCFDTLTPGARAFPHSVVTLRWYEAFAAGCAAVGKRPVTRRPERLLAWQDAAIDLPASPEDAVDFLHRSARRSRATQARTATQLLLLARLSTIGAGGCGTCSARF